MFTYLTQRCMPKKGAKATGKVGNRQKINIPAKDMDSPMVEGMIIAILDCE